MKSKRIAIIALKLLLTASLAGCAAAIPHPDPVNEAAVACNGAKENTSVYQDCVSKVSKNYQATNESAQNEALTETVATGFVIGIITFMFSLVI